MERASKKQTDLWLLFQQADSRACSKSEGTRGIVGKKLVAIWTVMLYTEIKTLSWELSELASCPFAVCNSVKRLLKSSNLPP